MEILPDPGGYRVFFAGVGGEGLRVLTGYVNFSLKESCARKAKWTVRAHKRGLVRLALTSGFSGRYYI